MIKKLVYIPFYYPQAQEMTDKVNEVIDFLNKWIMPHDDDCVSSCQEIAILREENRLLVCKLSEIGETLAKKEINNSGNTKCNRPC
jgi:hypothetical protein